MGTPNSVVAKAARQQKKNLGAETNSMLAYRLPSRHILSEKEQERSFSSTMLLLFVTITLWGRSGILKGNPIPLVGAKYRA